MSAGLTYLGGLSLATLVPGAQSAIVVALPELQARLAGAIAASAQLTLTPPTFAASLTAAADLVANLTVQGSLPSLSFQLTAIASLVASLQAQVNALFAIDAALGAAGAMHAYAWDGPWDELAPALPPNLPSGAPTDHVNALVLATTSPSLWVSAGVVLKTS